MAHTQHTVKQGDTIASIAYEHGLFPDAIWNDSKNSDLKNERKDPDLLCPDDVVHVREKEEKEESGATEQRHRFRRKGVPAKLKLQLLENDEPRANLDYVLEVDGELIQGTTDSDGRLEHFISPAAREAELRIGETEKIPLQIGHLEPVTTITGAQQRLNNLGFNCGESAGESTGQSAGEVDEETKAAITSFQQQNNLDPTGELDQKTQDTLKKEHGC